MSDSSTASLTTLRLGGMASGLDTESVIEVMVQYKQLAVDNLDSEISDQEELYGIWNEVDTAVSMLKVCASNLTSYTNWMQKTLNSNDSSIVSGTVSAYGGAEVGNYKVNVSQLAQAHRYNSDAVDDTSAELGYSGVFSINGVEVTVESTDTVESLKTKINDIATDTGVKAYIIGNKLAIESEETGTGNEMTLSSVSGDDVLTNMGFFNSGNEQEALDLEATINGISVTASSNTGVTSLISGVTLNFTDTGTTTISVARDTDSIKTLLNEFISAYNEAMSYMDEQTATTVSDGSEADVTGLLQGDTVAFNIKSRSRNLLTQINTNPNQMDQDFNCLRKIGIWTTSEENQLSIVDEEALDDALANHFEEVMELVRGYGDANNEGQGIFRQFETYMGNLTDPINGSITLREETINSDITAKQEKLAKMKVDLINYQADLWVHFAAMETAVSGINSQGSYVLSALGVNNSSSSSS